MSVLISAVLPGQVSGPPLSHKEGMLGVDRALQREDSLNSQDTDLGPFVLVNEEL